MISLPSQITAAILASFVTSFVLMLNALNVINLTPEQLDPVFAFVTISSNVGFGILLWAVNRNNPNPTAP